MLLVLLSVDGGGGDGDGDGDDDGAKLVVVLVIFRHSTVENSPFCISKQTLDGWTDRQTN